eukprot:6208524-Pleurochrysis_carterae.AAC.2
MVTTARAFAQILSAAKHACPQTLSAHVLQARADRVQIACPRLLDVWAEATSDTWDRTFTEPTNYLIELQFWHTVGVRLPAKLRMPLLGSVDVSRRVQQVNVLPQEKRRLIEGAAAISFSKLADGGKNARTA